MTMYYKATRLDGTDFRTGTVNYAAACGTGQLVTWPGTRSHYSAAGMVRDDPATYLSVSTELGEVLTGGQWPCLLFTVKPHGRTIGHSEWTWKRCCRDLVVLKELPAHQALGPNGEAVVALIERAKRLTAEEITAWHAAARNAAAWHAGHAAGDAAWHAAARNAAARHAGHAAWHATWYAARNAAGHAAGDAKWAVRHNAAYAVAYAAGHAARALVVRDLITPAQFQALYESWASLTGEAA